MYRQITNTRRTYRRDKQGRNNMGWQYSKNRFYLSREKITRRSQYYFSNLIINHNKIPRHSNFFEYYFHIDIKKINDAILASSFNNPLYYLRISNTASIKDFSAHDIFKIKNPEPITEPTLKSDTFPLITRFMVLSQMFTEDDDKVWETVFSESSLASSFLMLQLRDNLSFYNSRIQLVHLFIRKNKKILKST